jgi:serralysin
VVDGAGRIVLVGRASSSTILDMALARYHADGTLDTSFDGDGKLTADFHGRGEFGQGVAIDAHDRIVAGGYTANGADTEFALLRAGP